jgi:hypothetical protein
MTTTYSRQREIIAANKNTPPEWYFVKKVKISNNGIVSAVKKPRYS